MAVAYEVAALRVQPEGSDQDVVPPVIDVDGACITAGDVDRAYAKGSHLPEGYQLYCPLGRFLVRAHVR